MYHICAVTVAVAEICGLPQPCWTRRDGDAGWWEVLIKALVLPNVDSSCCCVCHRSPWVPEPQSACFGQPLPQALRCPLASAGSG